MRSDQHDHSFRTAFNEEFETLRAVVADLDLHSILLLALYGVSVEAAFGNESDWRKTAHLGRVKPLTSLIVDSCQELKR